MQENQELATLLKVNPDAKYTTQPVTDHKQSEKEKVWAKRHDGEKLTAKNLLKG